MITSGRATITDRPILFRGDMVRAILGKRKTVTRRPVQYIPILGEPEAWCPTAYSPVQTILTGPPERSCSLCSPGDRLWVRETWGLRAYGDETDWLRSSIRGLMPGEVLRAWRVDYSADYGAQQEACHWRPSIHMPRWASRLLLHVTGVTISHVDEIDYYEAALEGFESSEICRAALAGLYPGRDWFWRIEFEAQ